MNLLILGGIMIIVYQSLNSGNQKVGTPKENSSTLNGRFTNEAHTSYASQFNMITKTSSTPHTSQSGLYPTATNVPMSSTGDLVSLSQHCTPHEAGITNNRELVDQVINQ